MKEVTTYIIMNSTEDEVIEGILCELAGGFSLNGDLQFILIGDDNISNRTSLSHIEQYRKAYSLLNSKTNVICQQCLKETMLLTGNLIKDEVYNLFKCDNEDDDLKWEVAARLNKFDFNDIDENDSVIVVASTDDISSLTIFPLLKFKMNEVERKPFMRQVLWCSYKVSNENNKFILNHYVDLENTIIIGLRKDGYNVSMTLMQVVDAVLNAKNMQPGTVDGYAEVLSYGPENLENVSSSLPLYRMGLMLEFANKLQGHDGSLNKWISKLQVVPDRIWKDGESLPALYNLISNFGKFINNRGDFHVSLNSMIKDNFINALISGKVKINGQTEADKRLLRLQSIVSATESIVIDVSQKMSSIEAYEKEESPEELDDDNIYIAPSPTFIWELSDVAFAFDSNEGVTKRIRSFVLDLWQMFFKESKQEIESKLRIQEYDLHKLPNGVNQRFVKITYSGERLFNERFMFDVKSDSGSSLAYTSPLTGFALGKNPNHPIELKDGEVYFGKLCELNERSEDFCEFIYNYVRCNGGFSENFKNYVSSQIPISVKKNSESQGHNLIAIYPQFRHHVGLDIVKESDK